MADVIALNQEVLKPQNDSGFKSAAEVVNMAVASAIQTELSMHGSFETTTNTALALATEKLAEAAAKKDAEGIKNWTQVIETITKSRIDELKSYKEFNKVAKDTLTIFKDAP